MTSGPLLPALWQRWEFGGCLLLSAAPQAPGSPRPVSSTGLYTVNVSGKAQAGRKDAADAASFPRAEQQARTACEPRGAGFAGRSLGSHKDTLEQLSPSYLRRAQYFKALCHLKLVWWQRCDSHFTETELVQICLYWQQLAECFRAGKLHRGEELTLTRTKAKLPAALQGLVDQPPPISLASSDRLAHGCLRGIVGLPACADASPGDVALSLAPHTSFRPSTRPPSVVPSGTGTGFVEDSFSTVRGARMVQAVMRATGNDGERQVKVRSPARPPLTSCCAARLTGCPPGPGYWETCSPIAVTAARSSELGEGLLERGSCQPGPQGRSPRLITQVGTAQVPDGSGFRVTASPSEPPWDTQEL
ncbi:uncharacterized protein LOC132521566 [Lagenorhynchus albirostris]|uniref:uncharacterized protein LOC132521566 n=1 Tax=Lagenorhynchus albirostris TaxID=27610 RepID=UPI0028EADAC7|nr:uncharacterized protein LOC132521566 [Lagenorhynchus albirostris]